MSQRISDRIGLAGLWCFAFFSVASISGANLGLALMTVAFAMQAPAFWRRARRSPLLWLILGCFVYATISAMVAGTSLPETMDHQLDQLNKWGQLVFIVVVAWWLKDDPRRLHIALILFVAGACLRMAVYFPWDNTVATLQGKGQPVQFGLWHISFSAYLVAIMVAAVLFAPRILRTIDRPRLRTAVVTLLVAVALIAIEGVLLGKSRGTWVAAVATLPPLMFFYFRSLQSGHRALPRRYLAATAAIVVALLIGAVVLQKDSLSKRALEEEQTWQALLAGDLDKVPPTNIGIRIHLYRFGTARWLEKPWFGWGTGSEDHLMKMAGYKPGVYMPPHVHNLFLEVLVRFGVAGFALGALVVWMVYRNLWRLYREGRVPPDWYYFLMGMLAFNLVWSMFDIRIIRWDYRDYFLLLFGAAMALTPPFRETRLLDKLAART